MMETFSSSGGTAPGPMVPKRNASFRDGLVVAAILFPVVLCTWAWGRENIALVFVAAPMFLLSFLPALLLLRPQWIRSYMSWLLRTLFVALLGCAAVVLTAPLWGSGLSWMAALGGGAISGLGAAAVAWLSRRNDAEFRFDVQFFEPALALVDQRLRQFAQRVGGVYEPGSMDWSEYTGTFGRSAFDSRRPRFIPVSVYAAGLCVRCRYHAFEIEVGCSLEELTSGIVLVPRVRLALPQSTHWKRIPSVGMLDAVTGLRSVLDVAVGQPSFHYNHRSPGVLWTSNMKGPKLRPFSRTPEEDTRFMELTKHSCCVVSYVGFLDVRGVPSGGAYDPKQRAGYAAFDVEVLLNLVARTADFAQAAIT